MTMTVRFNAIFNEVKKDGYTVNYTDVATSYWAYNDIAYAKNVGWLNGYADGSSKGDNAITRAEVVTVVNRATNRKADEDYITKNVSVLNKFTDIRNNSIWYYADVTEAANTHLAISVVKGVSELAKAPLLSFHLTDTQYENEFAKIVMGHSIKAAEQERQLKQKELNSLIARDKELDNLFERLYEDNVCGKISDDRFSKMSVKYESEQKEIYPRIKELQTELDSEKSKAVTSDMFMASVRKYTRARKLTPRMLNELIEKIEVHQSKKIDGKTVQRLTIHYNCIGVIEIPDLDKLPENNVSVHTRQGLDVHYAACAS